jgi:hypothetical protein
MRANRSSRRLSSERVFESGTASSLRLAAERQALRELQTWRATAVPDAAPLEAEDLVRLLRDGVAVLGLDPSIANAFTVNTVHYYRRKDIIDPPDGRTAAARYGVRHLWQIAGARLAGYLGLVTLAEARTAMRGTNEEGLLSFLAARVTDARAKDAVRARDLAPVKATPAARPLPGRRGMAPSPTPVQATVIALPDQAWCVIPSSHAAHASAAAAEDLVRALAEALRVIHVSK